VSQICAEVARDAGAALSSRFVDRNAGSVVTTRAGLTYFRHLSNGTMQASFTGVHYTDVGVIDGSKESHTYLSAVLGYDRPIGHRLFAGIEGGARKLFQSGPDPKPDFNVNVYVRYRLGDLNR
jgi:hypothetical protein